MITPELTSHCSRYFTYRDLIECGETWSRLNLEQRVVPNLPKSNETWQGLARLAQEILDPVHEQFGSIVLTYGFAGPSLARNIDGGIAPRLDQHAGGELNRAGAAICARQGQSCDFFVPNVRSLVVGQWVRDRLPFDRLYLYGASRPLHVSFGPERSSRVYAILRRGRKVLPREIRSERVDELDTLFTSDGSPPP